MNPRRLNYAVWYNIGQITFTQQQCQKRGAKVSNPSVREYFESTPYHKKHTYSMKLGSCVYLFGPWNTWGYLFQLKSELTFEADDSARRNKHDTSSKRSRNGET